MHSSDLTLFRLEERILFDGAAAGDAAAAEAALDQLGDDSAVHEDGLPAESAALETVAAAFDPDTVIDGVLPVSEIDDAADETNFTEYFTDDTAVISTGKELVIINSSVPDIDTILNTLKPNQEVLLLEGNVDAKSQILDYLNDSDTVFSAIHILSHGNAGYFVLNGEIFDADSFDAAFWSELGQSLTDDGDIMLYGCSLAGNEAGRDLIALIAEASDADVAASDNTTGLGGDWELEFNIGSIETESITVEGYQYRLTNWMVSLSTDNNYTAGGEINGDGEYDLRYAITNAVGQDEISFAGDFTITLKAQITVGEKILTINGNGEDKTIIQVENPGVSNYRLFYLCRYTNISNLTLRGGYVQGSGSTLAYGGAIYMESYTYNYTYLNLTNVTITDSKADSGGAVYIGSGNYMITENCTFQNNHAVRRNYNLVLYAGGNGGAIYSEGYSYIRDSLFSDNSASVKGGAIALVGSSTRSGHIANSTFFGNSQTVSSSSNGGGAIYLERNNINIVSTTIAGNSGYAGGGILLNSTSTVSFVNALVAGNTKINGTTADDVSSAGTLNSLYSVFGTSVSTANNSRTVAASELFDGGTPVLRDNGGDRATVAVTAKANHSVKLSFCRDHNNIFYYSLNDGATWLYTTNGADASPNASLTTYYDGDSRGFMVLGNSSAGAYQHDGAAAYRVVNGQKIAYTNLEDALAAAVNHDTIYLAGLTFRITNSELVGPGVNDFTLIGYQKGGTVFTAGGTGSTITISAGTTLSLQNLTVQGNTVSGNGGAIIVRQGGSLILKEVTVQGGAAEYGGGIYNAGTVAMYQSTVTGNQAERDGGGIYNIGELKSEQSTFSSNTAVTGNGGGLHNAGQLHLFRTEFTGNAAVSGGGLYTTAAFRAEALTFTANTALDNGAGLYSSARTELYNSTFSENTAAGHGGGAYLAGDTVMEGLTFFKNTASDGGAVYVGNGRTLTLVNSTLLQNTSAQGALYVAAGGTFHALNNVMLGNIGGMDMDAAAGVESNLKYNIYGTLGGGLSGDGTNVDTLTLATLFGTPALADNGGYVLTIAAAAAMHTHADLAGRADLQIGKSADGQYVYRLHNGSYLSDAAVWTRISGGTTASGEYLVEDARGFYRLFNGYTAGAFQYNAGMAWYNSEANRDNENILLADHILTALTTATLGTVYNDSAMSGKVYLANTRHRVTATIAIYGDLHIVGGERTSLEATPTSTSRFRIMNIGPKAPAQGVAVHIPTVTIDNVIFLAEDISGNSANNNAANGAALLVYMLAQEVYPEDKVTHVTLNHCTFIGGKAKNGGAIYFESISTDRDMDDVVYADGTRYGWGSSLVINDCGFYNNSANENGGAIAASLPYTDDSGYGHSLVVNGGTFANNTALQSGGAVAVSTRSDYACSIRTVFNGVTFENNSAGTYGGAISFDATWMYYLGETNLSINDCTFTGNDARSNGGAIFFGAQENKSRGALMEINGTEFTENAAQNGGAIYVDQYGLSDYYGPKVYIYIQITISSWKVIQVTPGFNSMPLAGSVHATEDAPASFAADWDPADTGLGVFITGSRFTSNYAAINGGAIDANKPVNHIMGLVMHIDSSSFLANLAGENGGAINAVGYELHLINTTVAYNSAAVAGGVLLSGNWNKFYIVNSTVAANENGGLVLADNAEVEIMNSILTGNGAGDIVNDGSSFIDMAYSIYGVIDNGGIRSGHDNMVRSAAQIFGGATPTVTQSGTLAIDSAGDAFASGTRVAYSDGEYYYSHDGQWVGFSGVALNIAAGAIITNAGNTVSRVAMPNGGYNIGAHAMYALTVRIDASKVYDGTFNIGDYILKVLRSDGVELSEEFISITVLQYLNKNAHLTAEGLDYRIALADHLDLHDFVLTDVVAMGVITQRALTIDVGDKTVTYDGHTYSIDEYQESGLADGDRIADIIFSGGGRNAGEYTVSADGFRIRDLNGDDMTGNYLIHSNSGTLTIDQADLNIHITAEKIYDALQTLGYDEHVIQVLMDGLVEGDDVALDIASLIAGFADSNVHSEAALVDLYCELTGEHAGNYRLNLTGTGSILQREIIIQIGDCSKSEGEADPEFEWVMIDGEMVSGEDLNLILTRLAGEEAGVYAITGSHGASGNYRIVILDGTLTITAGTVDPGPGPGPGPEPEYGEGPINEWQRPYLYNLNYTAVWNHSLNAERPFMNPGVVDAAGLDYSYVNRFEMPSDLIGLADGENLSGFDTEELFDEMEEILGESVRMDWYASRTPRVAERFRNSYDVALETLLAENIKLF